MGTQNKINYCHFSLDKFYRHTRGFNTEQLAEYLNLYVEYMETGQCSSIPFALQPYWDSRGIRDDFQFLYERTLGSIERAKNAANSRWHKETNENNNYTNAILEQCTSINQAYTNINENINENINSNLIKNNTSAVFVLQHFNNVCKKNLKLTPEREKIINTRLKEGKTVEQLNIAITNFSFDTWEDRHKYCDIIYAIGVRNKIDNFDKWFNYKNTTLKDQAKEYIEKTGGIKQ